jgi:hypothetical protein
LRRSIALIAIRPGPYAKVQRSPTRLHALTGEERNSSRSHCAHDGHRFESPQLHQEVHENSSGFRA